MAYSDFTLTSLEKTFGLQNRLQSLFEAVTPLEPSEKLTDDLREARTLPIKSEKARSEWIVVPILKELRQRNHNFFTIYSGDNLNVDEARGLKGECDFILAQDTRSFEVSAPILQIVEAKKNDIEIGVPQCAAQMLGAKIFNEQKGVIWEMVYGCVTTGDDWLFLKLEQELFIDTRKYYLGNLGELLGVFQIIIDYFKGKVG